MIKTFLYVITSIFSKGVEAIAGVILLCVMVLTIADVVGRPFGMPIPGTYELVAAAGGLVIAFALPMSSIGQKHVVIDLILERLSIRSKMVLHIVSRSMAVILFFVIGWAFIGMGQDLRTTKEVSSVLHFPFYPLVYAMGGALLGESMVLLDDLLSLQRFREAHHE